MRFVGTLVGALLFFLPARLLRLLLERRRAKRRVVLKLRIDGLMVEEGGSRGLGGGSPTSLLPLLASLRAASEDPAVEAVAVRIGGLRAGWAQLEELREAIALLRRRGRSTFAYLENAGHAEYFLASAFEHVSAAPMTSLDLVGLRAEVTFWKGALDRLGVAAEFVAAGEYKSFGEPFTRDTMSPEFRESLDAVLAAVHGGFCDAVADGRGLDREAVQALLDKGPWLGEEAVDVGLLDRCLYPDRWPNAVRRVLGEPPEDPSPADSADALDRGDDVRAASPGSAVDTAGGSASAADTARQAPVRQQPRRDRPDPFEAAQRSVKASARPELKWVAGRRFLRPWRWLRRLERWATPAPRIALVLASGAIVDSNSSEASPGRISYRPLRSVLRAVADDPRIEAVVLRVDSPGGSGPASDLLWRELRRLRKKKPLVASMGSTAASGGYYLAMAADHIVASPLTVTGSIGVVAGKFDVSGLLGKAGVRREVLSYGAHTGLYSPTAGLNDSERARLQEQIGRFYDVFVDKAARCRGADRDTLEAHARGRIWTGRQAFERGLVDSVGSLQEALEEAARRARVGPGWETRLYRQPRARLSTRLQRLVPGAILRFLRPPSDLELTDLLDAEMEVAAAFEGLQARLPYELRLR